MKLTLLRLTQRVLSAIDSENVASVGDTEEANMVINIINRAYNELLLLQRWPHLKKISALNASANINQLSVPTGTIAVDVDSFYYNGKRIQFVEPEEFLRRTIGRDTSNANITTIGDYKIYTNREPTYFTTDNDELFTFEAVPNSISGLQANLSQTFIWQIPTSEYTADSDVVDLPDNLFPVLESLVLFYAFQEINGDDTTAKNHYALYKQRIAAAQINSKLSTHKKKIIGRTPTRRTR